MRSFAGGIVLLVDQNQRRSDIDYSNLFQSLRYYFMYIDHQIKPKLA